MTKYEFYLEKDISFNTKIIYDMCLSMMFKEEALIIYRITGNNPTSTGFYSIDIGKIIVTENNEGFGNKEYMMKVEYTIETTLNMSENYFYFDMKDYTEFMRERKLERIIK
jgi:hypothetical protein